MSTYTPPTEQVRDCYVQAYPGQPYQQSRDQFDAWLATVRPNPDDAEWHEITYWAVLNALPLAWTANTTIDVGKVADNIARAVLTALAEAVGRG